MHPCRCTSARQVMSANPTVYSVCGQCRSAGFSWTLPTCKAEQSFGTKVYRFARLACHRGGHDANHRQSWEGTIRLFTSLQQCGCVELWLSCRSHDNPIKGQPRNDLECIAVWVCHVRNDASCGASVELLEEKPHREKHVWLVVFNCVVVLLGRRWQLRKALQLPCLRPR